MISKMKEAIQQIKNWFVGIRRGGEKKMNVIPVWFPATRDHRYD